MTSGRTWSTWLACAAVGLVFGLPLFLGLGNLDMHNDEASYSYGVQRILETGNWATMRGTPDQEFLEKPPLKFWLVAGAMKAGLIPESDIGMREIDALFGAIIFVYVYLLGVRLKGPVAGGVAALVLFTFQPLIFDHGLRSNNMEAALLLAYCAGFYHVSEWIDAPAGRRRLLHAFGAALAFVLGFMTKFVVIAFLPVGALFVVLTHPARRALFSRERLVGWIAPALTTLALTAPWFIYQTWRIGIRFWKIILGQQVLERMSSGLDPSHLEPPAFYVTRIWTALSDAGTLWLVLAGLFTIIVMAIRGVRDGRLLLFWAVVPLAAISVSHSKIIHYAYPFVPPLALGAGWAVALVAHAIADRVAPETTAGLRGSPGRWLLLVIGVAALVLAGATLSTGRLVWHMPQGGVISNGSVVRPLLLGALLLWFAGRSVRLLLLAPILLILAALLPAGAYAKAIEQTSFVYRPLAAVNECLSALKAQGAALPAETFLASGYPPTHAYYYYLRAFGPYVPNMGQRDLESELHARLAPERASFLIFTRDDYWAWRDRVGSAVPSLPAILAENAYVLVLPGRAAACTAPAVQAGAQDTERP
jgi:4-amino-4-deoxy-L-arabinose transferase-like glycosyltransferase